jgi:hypothetical protein
VLVSARRSCLVMKFTGSLIRLGARGTQPYDGDEEVRNVF